MSRALPQAVQATHEALGWVIPVLDRFPRNRRFTLGERIEGRLLEVLELLIEATYLRGNDRPLRAANHKLAVVRHLWRLAYELQVIPLKPYRDGSERFVDIGRQIGGWQKAGAERGGDHG